MHKHYILLLFLISGMLLYAQSTIEKNYYNAAYRTKGAFLSKPLPQRTAKSLLTPVCINGYLWVYPIDLGYFTKHPNEIISHINKQNKYGRDNWRIPTSSELMTMEDNAAIIGLGDDIYMATSHSNGVLRLVSVEGEDLETLNCVKVGNTYWAKTNLGTKKSHDIGSVVTYDDAVRLCPSGYRLPTKAEYEQLIASGEAYFEKVEGNNNADLYFPAQYRQGRTSDMAWYPTYTYDGSYFIEGNNCYFEFYHWQSVGTWGETKITKPRIASESLSKGLVRYVLDK